VLFSASELVLEVLHWLNGDWNQHTEDTMTSNRELQQKYKVSDARTFSREVP
jgi:hypothetical protein